MLRGALEARGNFARRAGRALANAERTFRKLALSASLGAAHGRIGGERAWVAGYENGQGNGQESADQSDWSWTAACGGGRRASGLELCEQLMDVLGHVFGSSCSLTDQALSCRAGLRSRPKLDVAVVVNGRLAA